MALYVAHHFPLSQAHPKKSSFDAKSSPFGKYFFTTDGLRSNHANSIEKLTQIWWKTVFWYGEWWVFQNPEVHRSSFGRISQKSLHFIPLWCCTNNAVICHSNRVRARDGELNWKNEILIRKFNLQLKVKCGSKYWLSPSCRVFSVVLSLCFSH